MELQTLTTSLRGFMGRLQIDKLYQQQQKLQAKQDSQNKETSN
ncbi:hypothetical protein [Photobacterium leiognathi]|nr:hypothetical protein [Photobacterium leiognathi]